MRGLRAFWMRASGAFVCAVALALPYRPRLLFAKALTWLTNPVSDTVGMSFRKQARFWNKVILALVFFLGFPLAKFLLVISRRRPQGPRGETPTFWVARPAPEAFTEHVREPF